MHDLSNIHPVSVRELLAFVETGVSHVASKDGDYDLEYTLYEDDMQILRGALAALRLLIDAQPVPFQPVPLQQVSGPAGPYEITRVVGDLQKIVDRNHREDGDAVAIQAAIALLSPHRRGAA